MAGFIYWLLGCGLLIGPPYTYSGIGTAGYSYTDPVYVTQRCEKRVIKPAVSYSSVFRQDMAAEALKKKRQTKK